MTDRAVCSIIAKNYLAQARCFAASYRQHHPHDSIFVLLIDGGDVSQDSGGEPFVSIPIQALEIPELPAMRLRYTITELSTAVKPFFLEHLFRQHGCTRLCYFDPDIYFYSPVEEIWELLDSHGVVLIPHLSGFLDEDHYPTELDILRCGVYNLGFIGLSDYPELYTLLRWWQSKLKRNCLMSAEEGLFVDQRWMDLAPSLFSSVHIHRDPACNVAYWNLAHRTISRDEQGNHLVNGRPLKFFHFSGFRPDRPNMMSMHQNRLSLRDDPVVASLFAAYRECLLSHGYAEARDLPTAYNVYQGIRIPDVARRAWRRLEEQDPSVDPFSPPLDEAKIAGLLAWLNEPAVVTLEGQPVLTWLAMTLYESRPDLQRAYPDVVDRDRERYALWFRTRGKLDYGLEDFFVAPLARRATWSPKRLLGTPLRRLGVWLYYRITTWLVRIGIGAGLERRIGERRLNRIRSFFVRAQPSSPRVTAAAASPTGSSERQLVPPRAGEGGRRPVLPQSSAPAARLAGRPLASGRDADPESGVNVVGYLHDETGVGEAARAHLRALHAAGFPVACTTLRGDSARKQDNSVAHLPQGHPYGINLLHVNADQLPDVREQLGPSFFRGKYNIGYWAWEASPFPPRWYDRFRYLDEVWVCSQYIQKIVAQVAPIPVVCMGVGIERERSSGASRATLGLPEGEFLYLFVFDMQSVVERKNPLGLVEAYRRAFGPDFLQTRLVIKATRLEEFPREREELARAVASVHGLLIDRYLDRDELDGLFQACDAYVSLHRSEGFGITLAEAMCLGKPVIATAFSGNMDFMNVTNSYPVGYSLVELPEDYGPYAKGSVWAEPDLDDAAVQMRRVYENQAEAAQKGSRAAADIRELYGAEATAQRLVERLTLIEASAATGSAGPELSPAAISLDETGQRARRWSRMPSGILLEELQATANVNPHAPIAWPTWPKGLGPKAVALAQKGVRRLLRWYINPIVEQQNQFNSSVVHFLEALGHQLERLDKQAAPGARDGEATARGPRQVG